jgi:hypothetical protein
MNVTDSEYFMQALLLCAVVRLHAHPVKGEEGDARSLCGKGIEERSRLLHVDGAEPLRELPGYLRQHPPSLGLFVGMFSPKVTEAHDRAQLQKLRALATTQRDRLLKTRLRLQIRRADRRA